MGIPNFPNVSSGNRICLDFFRKTHLAPCLTENTDDTGKIQAYERDAVKHNQIKGHRTITGMKVKCTSLKDCREGWE